MNSTSSLLSSWAPSTQLTGEVSKAPLEPLWKKIRTSGPDPKRARRQYIGDLVCIYSRATGKRPGRWVHDIEGGEFRDFVIAALEPFKATQGCEADIKVALRSKHT